MLAAAIQMRARTYGKCGTHTLQNFAFSAFDAGSTLALQGTSCGTTPVNCYWPVIAGDN